MNIQELLNAIENDEYLDIFVNIYGNNATELDYQKQRYIKAVEQFAALYPEREDVRIFSAPGRTEIGGNHTDHQCGCVLAAAVNLDVIAVAAFHQDGVIRVNSEGYKPFEVSLDGNKLHVRFDGYGYLVARLYH